MIDLLGIAVAFVVAASFAFFSTPYIARLAVKLGAIDHPDGRRKCQAEPVPRGGGVAVMLAACLGIVTVVLFSTPATGGSSDLLWRGLLPAAGILLVVGVVDDVLTLTGIYKLIGQMLAVSVLVAGGTQFDQVSLFGVLIPLGGLRLPFTIFFCLGAINAFNLIDGVDALASSIGAVACVALGIITGSRGDVAAALICFAMAGALIGFLRHNVAPARVYLGDTGSMLIGLVVAAVAIDCSIKQQAAFVLAVPMAVCAIPILDAAAALVRRITTGQSVFTPDRGHLHHALLLRGWSVNKTVLIITALAGLTCGGALVSYFTGNDLFALAIVGGVCGMLALARVFGHVEAALIASHSLSLTKSILSRGALRRAPETESAFQLQGSRKWHKLWVALREAAPVYNLSGMTLQIGMPHLHESFYANWKSNEPAAASNPWRVTLPLKLDNQPVGKLTVIGSTDGAEALTDLRQIIEFLEPLHGQISELIEGGKRAADRERVVAPASAFHIERTGALDAVPGLLN